MVRATTVSVLLSAATGAFGVLGNGFEQFLYGVTSVLANPHSTLPVARIDPHHMLCEPNGSEIEEDPNRMSVPREDSGTRKVTACGTIAIKVGV